MILTEHSAVGNCLLKESRSISTRVTEILRGFACFLIAVTSLATAAAVVEETFLAFTSGFKATLLYDV